MLEKVIFCTEYPAKYTIFFPTTKCWSFLIYVSDYCSKQCPWELSANFTFCYTAILSRGANDGKCYQQMVY